MGVIVHVGRGMAPALALAMSRVMRCSLASEALCEERPGITAIVVLATRAGSRLPGINVLRGKAVASLGGGSPVGCLGTARASE